MQQSNDAPRALAGIRVLELAGVLSAYCAKMFAELGADVILIEPPGGAVTRRAPPFIHDEPGDDRSLAFNYFNTSKRGITLDLDSREGQILFRELATGAHLVLETGKPGALAAKGCGYDALSRVNPALVLTSITGFGQTGPYAQYEWEDLVGLATGGFLYLGGYTDSPPIGAYGEQAFLGASMYGGVASMLAVTRAELTGEGEHVDVSMQECMVMAMETAVQFYDLEGKVRQRHADVQRFAGTGVFQCKDGYIYMMASGIGANKFWPLSLRWLVDEKVPGVERLQGEEWNAVEYVGTDEAKAIFEAVFAPWAKTRTKAYLYEEGQRRHIPMAAINTPADLIASPQLAERGYFVDVPHPGLAKPMRMPGAPYRLAATPWRMERPAPGLGEHNSEIFAELGVSREKLAALQVKGIV